MIKRALVGGLAALFVIAAQAQSETADIKKTIESFFGVKVDSVRNAGFLGLYEVQVGGDILYTDKKANYVVVGNVIDTKSHKNLTEERTRPKFSELPFDLAIKQVRGNGKRVFATFEDPNCGYCKKLAKELSGMTDVTIYTFLLPILSPESGEKSKAIWCAPDKVKAWNDWMINGNAPVAANCDAPNEKVQALGKKLKINGTPTIFFADGSRVPGYVPAAQIEQTMNKIGSGS